ncbi:hypothetical protein BC833DRAFT_602555 [Globomyces pollinis-pini]|nr:hypothetical protein BC833DRAFT_602555 [Globomyces pollinis-pini]
MSSNCYVLLAIFPTKANNPRCIDLSRIYATMTVLVLRIVLIQHSRFLFPFPRATLCTLFKLTPILIIGTILTYLDTNLNWNMLCK